MWKQTSSILAVTVALGACASQRFEGGAVPTGKAAIAIANRLCPTFGMRTGPWHVSLEDGQWKLWRFDGRQTIKIDAASGDTFGCRSA